MVNQILLIRLLFILLLASVSVGARIEKVDFRFFSAVINDPVLLRYHRALELIHQEVDSFSDFNLTASVDHDYLTAAGSLLNFVKLTVLRIIGWEDRLLKLEFSAIELQIQKLIYHGADMFTPTGLKLFCFQSLSIGVSELFEVADQLGQGVSHIAFEIDEGNKNP